MRANSSKISTPSARRLTRDFAAEAGGVSGTVPTLGTLFMNLDGSVTEVASFVCGACSTKSDDAGTAVRRPFPAGAPFTCLDETIADEEVPFPMKSLYS